MWTITLIFVLFIFLFSVGYTSSKYIRLKTFREHFISFRNENNIKNNDITSKMHCSSKCTLKTQAIIDLLNYDEKKSGVSLNAIQPVSYNVNHYDGDWNDILIIYDLRNKIRNDLIEILYNQNQFIVVFEKPNFLGKMYLFPSNKHIEWHSPFHTNKNEETGSINKNNNHMHISKFIHDFNFYHGLAFSCIVPKHCAIELIPIQMVNISSQNMIIRAGKHDNIKYFMSKIKNFIIHIDKNVFS
jgi:hypothetical protein